MDKNIRSVLRSQFTAALELLEKALQDCPDSLWKGRLWRERERHPQTAEFWYIASQALLNADRTLSTGSEKVDTRPPRHEKESARDTFVPGKVYSRDELLKYLTYCRRKSRSCINRLSDETRPLHRETTSINLLLDTVRHIQAHAAQLNLYLGQARNNPTRWISLDQ